MTGVYDKLILFYRKSLIFLLQLKVFLKAGYDVKIGRAKIRRRVKWIVLLHRTAPAPIKARCNECLLFDTKNSRDLRFLKEMNQKEALSAAKCGPIIA